MLEKPWIKKDSNLTEEELKDTAQKALAHAEETNATPTLDVLQKRGKMEIRNRFPATNDDTLREDAAIRSLTERMEDLNEKIVRASNARTIEKAAMEQMQKLHDRLADIHLQIMNEMEENTRKGMFSFGKTSEESQKKLAELEIQYEFLETHVRNLHEARDVRNAEEN